MQNPNTSTSSSACTMNDHGSEHAAASCCRPGSPNFMGHQAVSLSRASRLAFWQDGKAWRKAAKNTLNCLIGCMIGDLAVVIFMQAKYPQAPMMLTMALAMIAGLITSILFESSILRWKEGFSWRAAFTMAFSMSFLSMLGMEFAANATDFMLTGGRVPFSDPFYWTALLISVAAGFLAPLPYNYWKFKKHGKACH